MYDLLCRKIIAVCQHGNSSWLLIAAAVTGAEPGHTAAALCAQLDAGKGMDAVIDTGVHRHKAAQHL